MKNVEIHEDLQNLRRIADVTLLRELDMSEDFGAKVWTQIGKCSQTSPSVIKKMLKSGKLLASVFVVMVTALILFGFLHFQSNTHKIGILSAAAMASVPAASAVVFMQNKADKTGNRFGMTSSALVRSPSVIAEAR